MRSSTTVVALFMLSASIRAQSPPPPAPRLVLRSERFDQFVDDSAKAPFFYAQTVAGGIIDEIAGFPHEWSGASGFERRTAARIGVAFTAAAIGNAAAATLHDRVRYDPCVCSGWHRVNHALLRAFVSVTDANGRAPNYPLWIARYAAAGVANAWYPTTYTRRDALWQGTGAIGTSAGLNILREFGPQISKVIRIKIR